MLVALLAVMAIMALLLVAAAPSIRQQSLRAREALAISRGEEVAEAIRRYYVATHRLPNSMEELLEGAPQGTKKLQVLRAEAARDPLSKSGEWKLIGFSDVAQWVQFQKDILTYTGGVPLVTSAPMTDFAVRVPQAGGVINTEPKTPAPCDEDDSENPKAEFIGVASRNRCDSVITYYGIDRHDHWIFTPLFR